jgi:hypothetical protein
MIQQINLDIQCKKCGGALNISQTELGILKIGICRGCVKAKVIQILRAKKADFDATYDSVEETLLNENPPA